MLAIRLKRMGSKHRPFYRIVVSENDKRPRSSHVEELGYYHPVAPGKPLKINTERAEYWLSKGARPSETVAGLLKKQGVKA
ncbi:30S ribosomal protein S16 [Sulfidibacter corallicola]|uniref:Small ribosomal subunit protein bS16 n=1 Tax=Sulfidibacter corallicola TaxID=2818388 RepID=A0A8A4TU04_SULCO|nr:30S ribosomal protein S16 [Sulfidibacter corallicola]QTD52581.1 30S ribosomal protein S16 [Sulfidibacter corallicola]